MKRVLLKLAANFGIAVLAVIVVMAGTMAVQGVPPDSLVGRIISPIAKSRLTIGLVGVAYAATPDYLVDGTADDVQVQAALNALPSTGGQLILFGGNYNFSATATRAINNVTISGDGKGTYVANNGATALFSAGAQTGWVFKDFRTDAGFITMANDTVVDRVWNNTTLVMPAGASTIIVASVNATASEKAAAHFIADGAADDVEIQAAINALPVTGGTVSLVGTAFNLNAGLTIGNGSSAAVSTRNGIVLHGQGSGVDDGAFPAPYGGATGTILRYVGGATTSVVTVSGAINGVQITDLAIDANGLAGTGLNVINAIQSTFEQINISGYTSIGLQVKDWEAAPITYGTNRDTFINVSTFHPASTSANGTYIAGYEASAVGVNQCVFIGGWWTRGGAASSSSLEIKYVDNSSFYNQVLWGGNTTALGYSLRMDQGVVPTTPCDNAFYNVAFLGSISGTSGTLGNVFFPYPVADGETIPTTNGQISGMTGTGRFFGTNPDSVRVYHNADQTINHATFTSLAFNSERWDSAALHSTLSNNSRLTAVQAGIYLITGSVYFANSSTSGRREVYILLNNTTVIANQHYTAASSGSTNMVVTTAYQLAVGDYVELGVWQDSGGALAVSSVGNTSPEFSMTRLN